MNSTALNVASLRRIRTALLRFLATLPLSLGAIAIAPAPASAHTELTYSSPASGAHLDSAPAIVVLEFSEDVDPRFATVVVTRAEGKPERLDIAAGVASTEIQAAVQSAKSSDDEMSWRIDYRVTSVDGHPVQGNFTFTVNSATEELPPAPSTGGSTSAGPGGPEASSIPEAQGDAEAISTSKPQVGESLFGSQRWMFVAMPMAVFMVGLAIVLVMARQNRRGERPSDPTDRS